MLYDVTKKRQSRRHKQGTRRPFVSKSQLHIRIEVHTTQAHYHQGKCAKNNTAGFRGKQRNSVEQEHSSTGLYYKVCFFISQTLYNTIM